MKAGALWMEAALALALAWVLVFLVPLRRSHRLFGAMTQAAPAPDTVPAGMADSVPGPVLARARAMAVRTRRVAEALPWHSTCLAQAVAGRLLLARRGIRGGAIRFGVRKADGDLQAHAWLILGGTILMGGEEAGAYVPLADLTAPTSAEAPGPGGQGWAGGR